MRNNRLRPEGEILIYSLICAEVHSKLNPYQLQRDSGRGHVILASFTRPALYALHGTTWQSCHTVRDFEGVSRFVAGAPLLVNDARVLVVLFLRRGEKLMSFLL